MTARRYRVSLIALGLIVARLVILRLLLPWVVLSQLNRHLADMGDYRGHIEDVTWHCGVVPTHGPERRSPEQGCKYLGRPLVGILRNAFVKALQPRYDHSGD